MTTIPITEEHPETAGHSTWRPKPSRCDEQGCEELVYGRVRLGTLVSYLCEGHLLAEPYASAPARDRDIL